MIPAALDPRQGSTRARDPDGPGPEPHMRRAGVAVGILPIGLDLRPAARVKADVREGDEAGAGAGGTRSMMLKKALVSMGS
jgi:hypothetical protein